MSEFVYIVFHQVDYHDHMVRGVFKKEENADQYVAKQEKEDLIYFSIQEHELKE